MAGAGIAPAGTSIAGYGTVTSIAGSPAQILVDPNDGVSKDTRAVNPVTRQYTYDSQGRPTGQSGVPHLVQMALMTLRNSSAVANFGLAAPPPLITANVAAQLTRDFNLAVKDLVDQRLIQVVSITVDRAMLAGERVRFTWRDLTTSLQTTSTL